MVRDEEDILEHTIRHMASQVDQIIVADNLSTDRTPAILSELAERFPVHVIVDDDPAFRQSEKMTALAQTAGESWGADWVVPFDADEIWSWSDGTIVDCLNAQPSTVDAVIANVFDHIATGADSDDPDPVNRITWRNRKKHLMTDVACRWKPDLMIAAGNHCAYYKRAPVYSGDLLNVRHFSRRSAEQMIRYVRNGYEAHRAADFPKSIGAHFWKWGRLLEEQGEQAIVDLFYREFYVDDPSTRADLIEDAAA